MDLEYLDIFDPLEQQIETKEEQHAESSNNSKKEKRRKFDLIEIPDKILFRKAYGVMQFLDRMKFTPPQAGYSIHVITGGNVDMICYLQYILLHFEHLERVIISTWCLGTSDDGRMVQPRQSKSVRHALRRALQEPIQGRMGETHADARSRNSG